MNKNQPFCEYKCQKCLREFKTQLPGPVECPYCGNLYVTWLNFEKVLNFLRNEKMI